jgi:hypothetical protein
MVNMGVQYIIALLSSLALGYVMVKSRRGNSGDEIGVIIAEALCLSCSVLFLTIFMFPLYTFFNCHYKSPGLWMFAILASTIAALNHLNIYIESKFSLIAIAIVLQIIGLFVLQCNKKLTYSNVTKN